MEQTKDSQKSVIALACSPSKGRNSDAMLDAFIAGIESATKIPVKKYYLTDIEIAHFAFENRLGPTDTEKDFSELCELITKAHGLIIATPTYNFSVPAQLKNFIDRIRFFALDFTKMNTLKQPTGNLGYLHTYYLVSGGTPNWAQKILFFAYPAFWLRSVFLYFNAQCMGAYYSGDIATFNNEKVLARCKKKGAAYGKDIEKEKCHAVPERIFWRPPQHN
jgi:multimeric flavodoxin WrbA